ncbi:MAG: hypothetical protein ACEY3A_05260 [Wolbachia sp.]
MTAMKLGDFAFFYYIGEKKAKLLPTILAICFIKDVL